MNGSMVVHRGRESWHTSSRWRRTVCFPGEVGACQEEETTVRSEVKRTIKISRSMLTKATKQGEHKSCKPSVMILALGPEQRLVYPLPEHLGVHPGLLLLGELGGSL